MGYPDPGSDRDAHRDRYAARVSDAECHQYDVAFSHTDGDKHEVVFSNANWHEYIGTIGDKYDAPIGDEYQGAFSDIDGAAEFDQCAIRNAD